MAAAPPLSVIVPVLNEADRIRGTLRRLRRDAPGCQLLVVDGGSVDGTPELASALAEVITAPRGRGPQLNAGARQASGDLLWFHHVDTVAAPGALEQMRAALSDPRVVGGGLTLAFDRRSPGLDYLAWSSNHRARRLGLFFGDQAMFLRRQAFEAVGGFPDVALMEDLEISRRLRRVGPMRLLAATSTASARRFEHGTWRMVAFMQYLKVLHLAGVDPAAVHHRYLAGPARLPVRGGHPRRAARGGTV